MGREVTENPPPAATAPESYTVEQLVAINPYNPELLPELEKLVNEQLPQSFGCYNSFLPKRGSGAMNTNSTMLLSNALSDLFPKRKLKNWVNSKTYNLDANLCLLRLYQSEPERMSTVIIARILVKALMAMPAPDFSLCLFLIPESVQMEEEFKTLIVLSHFLETARFRQFWDEAAKNRHLLEVIPGFQQAIQSYAIHVLSLTYQKLPRTVLAEAVNIEGVALDKFIEHHVANSGWALDKGHSRDQLIIQTRTEFNHPELKKNAADNIPLEHITKILPILK